ncbi:MAG: hypothetical protein R3F25_03365 [Gammaproteobacteria bacterium]|nr:hypothetical protein [Xanthomonadales bacterium]MCB1595321.1 hypothetical protein [Xanthomonadales bacterium]
MEKNIIILFILIVIAWWLLKTPSFTDSVTNTEIKYQIRYPTGSSDDDLPIVIALHGNGDTVENFYKHTFEGSGVHARVILIEAPDKYWPYIQHELQRYSSTIASFAEYVYQEYSPSHKPLLLGYSGGGVVAYYSALTECNRYSLIMPISGMLRKDILPDNINTDYSCKVKAYHGKTDNVVSFSGGEFAISEIQKHTNSAELVSVDGDHHVIFRDYKKMILDDIKYQLVTD